MLGLAGMSHPSPPTPPPPNRPSWPLPPNPPPPPQWFSVLGVQQYGEEYATRRPCSVSNQSGFTSAALAMNGPDPQGVFVGKLPFVGCGRAGACICTCLAHIDLMFAGWFWSRVYFGAAGDRWSEE